MLVIRMQRTGRKGHAMFRMVVQDSRLTPTSGKVVAQLGSYDPHAKTVTLDKEKATFYLTHGAQPSVRASRLLTSEDIALPAWVKLPTDKARAVRHADKRRSTAPPAAVEESAPEATTESSDQPSTETVASEETRTTDTASTASETASDEVPATDVTEANADEKPAT